MNEMIDKDLELNNNSSLTAAIHNKILPTATQTNLQQNKEPTLTRTGIINPQ